LLAYACSCFCERAGLRLLLLSRKSAAAKAKAKAKLIKNLDCKVCLLPFQLVETWDKFKVFLL
jgi:hypothetical protein